jgi:putative ABC transport system substrate-binding protein
MRRRAFITVLGGAAVTWPVVALAQQRERVRRVGVLLPASADDPEFQVRLAAFHQGLGQLGWIVGQNVRIETHWATARVTEIRRHAVELAASGPDVVLAHGSSTLGPMLDETRTLPIIFPVSTDPVAAGFVGSLARPGGNVTGFMNFEYSQSGKYLELLKEITPGLKRVAVLRDPTNPSGGAIFGVIQTAAQLLRIEANVLNMRCAGEVEHAIDAFAHDSYGGMIVVPSGRAFAHRDMIIAQVARHKLPTIYFDRLFVNAGGLVSFGSSEIDQYRRAASYVDRILKGEKPADLPVQAPIKYELVINLKTAKALGLTVPTTLLASADEVIE